MRIRFGMLLPLVLAATAWAQPPAPAPFEVVKDHVDIEVAPDGSDISSHEEVFRVLDSRGIDLLHERRIAFAQRYENVRIIDAYTLKANGQRIAVPRGSVLAGFGQTSRPGFQDYIYLSIFYPNLEVGDSVVLSTVHRQATPWFADHFDYRIDFTRTVPVRDARIALSAPSAMALTFDQAGLEEGAAQTAGGKTRWTWQFHNDVPVTYEPDGVAETDFGPHLAATSFRDYGEVARAYADRSRDASKITPEIAALAEELTKGVTDRREQTRILYEWVSAHIAYVEIVLGAGGFTPHDAKDVLSSRFGDCKDHVALLEALLKAKGIDSTGALMRAGAPAYALAVAAMPHAFDHIITYVPEFDLYLDSTAQIAPFGVLPYSEVGKPVLKVATGAVAHTPVPTPLTSTVKASSEITLQKDGTAKGVARVSATGAMGVGLREAMRNVQAGDEGKFLREKLGPGADGTLDRGDPMKMSEPYLVTANYTVPAAISVPGPGAVPSTLALKPFLFTQLVSGALPAVRNSDYVCLSMSAEQDVKFTFPEGFKLLSIPDPGVFTAEGIRLTIDYDRLDARTLSMKIALNLRHPQATCTTEFYRQAHGALEKMVNALKEEIIYRGPKRGSQ